MKTCTQCLNELELAQFYFIKSENRYRSKCKKCYQVYLKQRKDANRDKHLEYLKQYRAKNKDKLKQSQIKWYSTKGKQWKREYDQNNKQLIRNRDNSRYRTDVQFRLKKVLRTRFQKVLNGSKKSESVTKLLGCKLDEFEQWIEYQFSPDMTWETYGELWNIDHVIPCAKFNLSDPEHQKLCFHWSNCRPLSKPENESKNSKIVPDIVRQHHGVVKDFLLEYHLHLETFEVLSTPEVW